MPTGHFPRNTHRLPPRSRSGLKGVLYFPRCPKKPWKAYGRHHGQYVCIGYFETKEQAAREYNKWAIRFKGKDSYFNPITPR